MAKRPQSKLKSQTLSGRLKFSRNQAIAVIAVMVLVGGYVIYRSLAATSAFVGATTNCSNCAPGTPVQQVADNAKKTNVVQLASGQGNKAVIIASAISGGLDAGIYKVCLTARVASSGGAGGTITATAYNNGAVGTPGSINYLTNNAASYTQVACLSNLAINPSSPGMEFTVTNTGGTALNIASFAVTKTGDISKSKPVFAYYYLWWDHNHWTSHLGPNYPYSQSPNPLPATLDSNSCGTVNKYSGNTETDVSQNLAYDQSNPAVILNDVEAAAGAGISGFAVNWIGDGTTAQSSTWAYNERLASVIAAVHQVNAEGKAFKLILNYQSSAKILTLTQFNNDLNYLSSKYGTDAALDHTYSTRPEIILAGTWKYSDADVTSISKSFRSKFYLIGDEKPASWDAARAAAWDGVTYYWSSQNPYTNASSFSQLQNFAATIRQTKNPDGSAKVWLSPFIAGYNGMLYYNNTTCVPRNNGQTASVVYDGNLASAPNGWAFISWNEITEGSYVVPLTRYGNQYLNVLHSIILNGK